MTLRRRQCLWMWAPVQFRRPQIPAWLLRLNRLCYVLKKRFKNVAAESKVRMVQHGSGWSCIGMYGFSSVLLPNFLDSLEDFDSNLNSQSVPKQVNALGK